MKTVSPKNFKFQPRKRGFKQVYDWAKMLDGSIYQATQGEDFNCTADTFVMMLRNKTAAENKGLNVQTNDDKTVVTFQAVKLTDEQIALRNEARAKRKANKAAKAAPSTNGDGEHTGAETEGEGDAPTDDTV